MEQAQVAADISLAGLEKESSSRIWPPGWSCKCLHCGLDATLATLAAATTNAIQQLVDDGRLVGGGGGMPYGNPWVLMPQTVVAGPREDSLARASRRQKLKEYDAGAMNRTTGGHRPNKLRMKDGGDIDGGCPGKNAWDDVVKSLVPQILDISVIEWEVQKIVAVEKLRKALNMDFEYVPVTLSQHGFRNAIKRFMKTERFRLKARYMAGDITCPVHIGPRQWQRLQEYWGSNLQREKAEKMTITRKQVKNIENVGRKGKNEKEATVVSACLLNVVLHYLRVVIFHSQCMYI
jgi:hypothetical protein